LLAALPPFTRGALLGEVRGYDGITPFVRWGNRPAVGLALLIVVTAAIRRRQHGRSANPTGGPSAG